MHIKVLKSWTLRVAVFGLLINEPLLFPSVAISQDTHVSSPITTLQDNQPLPSDFLEIFQDKTVLSLITTLREIDNTERHSPYERCVYHDPLFKGNIPIFDSNCELKEEFEAIAQFLPSIDNIPAIAYLSDQELIRLKETLKKLIELETKSVYPLKSLLQDNSQLLRESAIYALSEISRSSTLVRLGVEQPILGRSAKLARLGIEQSLLEVLANDESPAVRDSAAFALARIEPRPEVIDVLIKTLFDNQKPIKIRQRAGQVLNEISLNNISLESVKFLVQGINNLGSTFNYGEISVKETNNLGLNLWINRDVNVYLVQQYCVYAKGILSDPYVAYILINENISSPSKTCDLPNRLSVRELYRIIKNSWLGNG